MDERGDREREKNTRVFIGIISWGGGKGKALSWGGLG